MGLLSPQDEAVLKEHLSAITKPVTLLLFTQTIGGSESGAVAKTRRRRDRRAQRQDHRRREELRARYRGPGQVRRRQGAGHRRAERRRRHAHAHVRRTTGYEFVGLVEAIVVAGTGKLDLDPQTMAWIRRSTSRRTSRCFRHPLDRIVRGRSSWRTRWQRRTRTSRRMRSKPRSSWTSPRVPRHGRAEDDRQRDDRDPRRPAEAGLRPRRARDAGRASHRQRVTNHEARRHHEGHEAFSSESRIARVCFMRSFRRVFVVSS